MAKFTNGEKVLCFHGSLMYEAKCLKSEIKKDNHISYLIHYTGWNRTWDEWVPESRIFKYNDHNVLKQKELVRAHNKQQAKSKRKTEVMSDGNEKKMRTDSGEEYTCTSCFISFCSEIDLDKHWQWHVLQLEHMQSCCVELNKLEIFKCDNCTTYFPDVANLKAHQEKHFEIDISTCQNNNNRMEKPFICTTCRCEFTQESSLESHSLLHKSNLQIPPDEKVTDIIMEENEMNKIYESEANIIYENETSNIGETNNKDENEKTQMDENEPIRMIENETNKIYKNETNKKVEGEINKMVENETKNKMDETEIKNNLDENVSNKIKENDTNNVDENETNKINDNETNKINVNDLNKIDETEIKNKVVENESENKMYETEIKNKVDENETENKMDETEIKNKVDENETENKMDEIEIKNKVDENETNKIDDNETNKIDENDTENKMDETEIKNNVDENVTNKIHEKDLLNKIDENDLNKIDENKSENKIDENKSENEMDETEIKNKVDETEIKNKVDENETNEIDENNLNKIDENETENKMDETEIKNKVDENETNEIDENNLNKIDDYETENKMDETEMKNKVDKNETNKMDDNETENKMNETDIKNKVDENETNKINEKGMNKINENETNIDKYEKSKIENNDMNNMKKNKTTLPKNKMNKIKRSKFPVICFTNNRNESKKTKTYSCSVCYKKFSILSKFNKHRQVHTQQKFTQQKTHMEQCNEKCSVIINRVKIFKCDFCTSCFLDAAMLKQHQRKYFNKDRSRSQKDDDPTKPYKCETCGWRFKSSSTLDAHSILHKPFPHICECGIGFYQKCDLDGHRRLVHPNYKPLKPSPLKTKQKTKKQESESESKSESESESKSESESESDTPRLKPNSKLGPRLKACLTFKQPKTKIHKSKRPKTKTHTPKRPKQEKQIKPTRVHTGIKMELDTDENGNYACTLCAETFLSIVELITHLYQDHTRKVGGVIKCNICDKASPNTSASSLREHMISHAGLKPYVCHICKGRYSQISAIQLHLKRHAGDKQFPCIHCDKRFYNTAQLNLHMRVHTGEKPYECKQCCKSFSDPSAFKRHLLIHTGEKPFQCQICAKAFCDRSALYRHKRMHQGYKESCSECDKTFSSKTYLSQHVKQTHRKPNNEDQEKARSYECDYCNKLFPFKNNVRLHILRMHMDSVNEVQCGICGNKYCHAINLRVHMRRVHLKETNCECDICGARFLYKSILRVHKENIHSHRSVPKDKEYECDHCHKSYYTKHHLIHHITGKHLGIVCKICKRIFSTSLKLKKHKSGGCRQCPVCNVAFQTFKQLEEHKILTHLPKSEQPLYECDRCGKQFPIKSRLQQHFRCHDQSTAYHCDHCPEVFNYRTAIVTHIWTKHMVSLYCNICLKRFYTESEFREHKRAARCSSRSVMCEICNRMLPDSNRLRQHLLYHGPKRMECDMCGDKFIGRSSLIRHIRLVHKISAKRKVSKWN